MKVMHFACFLINFSLCFDLFVSFRVFLLLNVHGDKDAITGDFNCKVSQRNINLCRNCSA